MKRGDWNERSECHIQLGVWGRFKPPQWGSRRNPVNFLQFRAKNMFMRVACLKVIQAWKTKELNKYLYNDGIYISLEHENIPYL